MLKNSKLIIGQLKIFILIPVNKHDKHHQHNVVSAMKIQIFTF